MFKKVLLSTLIFFISSNYGFADDVLITNITTLITTNTKDNNQIEVLHNKDILVVNGVISNISENIPHDKADVVIDATGKIVIPGFVDTHDHLWQLAIRGCGNNLTVSDWLPECIYLQKDFTKSEAFYADRLATYDLINTGVTTVMDWNHSYSVGMVYGGLEALQQSGLRYVYGFLPSGNDQFDQNAYQIKNSIDQDPLGKLEIAGLVRTGLAKRAVDLAKQLSVPVNFHYKESADKTGQALSILEQSGAGKIPLILNHVIHVDQDDIDFMVKSDAKLTYNPLSNMRLGSGVMPISKLHDAGLTVGLQRATNESALSYPTYQDIFRMATIDGAKVLGLDKVTGSLEIGKSADLIIINPVVSNMAASFDEIAQIALNAEPADVELVMVNGKILKENGKLIFTNDSLEDLVSENQKTVDRLKNRHTAR